MLSRLGQILFSMLTNRLEGVISATMLAITHEILKKGRRTLFLVIFSFVLSILLSAGVIISILEAASQYDARGTIFFTALLTCSLVMTGVSIISLAILFWPRNPSQVDQQAKLEVHAPLRPFEEILSAAIAEGIEYFKNYQQTKARRSTDYSKA